MIKTSIAVPSVVQAAAAIVYERVGPEEWGKRDNRGFADSCLAMWVIDGCPDWDSPQEPWNYATDGCPRHGAKTGAPQLRCACDAIDEAFSER